MLNYYRRYKMRNYPIIVSYPKTGRTWLRFMLKELNLNFVFSHDQSEPIQKISYKDYISNVSNYKKKKVIFLIRDPKDTVVSMFFQMTKREKLFQGNISDFIRNDIWGIKKIVWFYKLWSDDQGVPASILIVKYEDLKQNTTLEINRICTFIGQERESDTIQNVVDLYSFENMHNKEAQSNSDKDSLKARKAKVGGYVDMLNAGDIDYCNKVITETNCPWYSV